MDWLKKAPTAVVVTMILVCGVLAVSVLVAYVWLAAHGADTTEFRQWVNTIGQLILLPIAGGGTIAAVSAARSASRAEDQTNGQLHRRDAEIAELRRRLADRDGL